MATAIYREYMHTHNPVRETVSDDDVAARSDRFATLAGRDIIDWGAEGPDYPKLVKRPFRYTPYT